MPGAALGVLGVFAVQFRICRLSAPAPNEPKKTAFLTPSAAILPFQPRENEPISRAEEKTTRSYFAVVHSEPCCASGYERSPKTRKHRPRTHNLRVAGGLHVRLRPRRLYV